MRSLRLFTLFALLLGACVPAASVSAPAEAPTRAGTAVGERRLVVEPEVELAAPPENWWLLDEVTDRVRGIGVERTYRELLAGRQPARSVVVAIIDTGIDITHEDLRANLWVNPGEIPGTGRDEDGNGYVDDVHGWNFIGGPDGRHVHHDSYELTRLYARLRPRYEGARADTLSPAARAEYQQYRQVRTEFESKRRETLQQLQQIEGIDAAVTRLLALLRRELGTDSLTVARVGALRTPRGELRQAQEVFLQMEAAGITPALIAEERERLRAGIEHKLNPAFDPRPIVGDDYHDPADRFYGNADVFGPFADHGTHVAGIIAAQRGNQLGIEGIAPAVRIMVLRVVPEGDERDKDIANAIRYAVDNGAQIINMSFGKGYSPEKQLVDEAVRYADARGVLMVAAAGNDGADLESKPSFPTRTYLDGGAARNWISVGASAWWAADSLAAPFSNYGRTQVDVFAPGVAIHSTVPGDGYETKSGTSMAAPVVSGLAALLMAYYPELDAAQVRQVILESATRHADRRVVRPGGRGARVAFAELSSTGGIVNAYAAVQLAEELSRQAAAAP